LIVFIALLALLIGALLNHLADRLPARERPDRPPRCKYCSAVLSPMTWVSTIAYLTARFGCASCGAPVPVRKPVVEIVNVLGWIGLYESRGLGWAFFLGAFYVSAFLLILITDLEHRLILDVVVLPSIIVGLLGSFLPGAPSPQSAALGGTFGFLVFWLIASLGRGAMGAGDVKLAAFIGVVVGFPSVITALLFGILAGGVVALVLVVLRFGTRRTYIPYGPFLLSGGVLMAFFGPLVQKWFVAV
jgi:leader peptidase (prepilin peptidase) / N-methyltransferase